MEYRYIAIRNRYDTYRDIFFLYRFFAIHEQANVKPAIMPPITRAKWTVSLIHHVSYLLLLLSDCDKHYG